MFYFNFIAEIDEFPQTKIFIRFNKFPNDVHFMWIIVVCTAR